MKIAVLSKELLPNILEKYIFQNLHSKTRYPIEKYIYDDNGYKTEITVYENINNSLRGNSSDIFYITPDDYNSYSELLLPLLINNNKAEIRIKIKTT